MHHISCGWQKGTSRDGATSNSEINKSVPHSLSSYSMLGWKYQWVSEGVSQHNRWNRKIFKIHKNFLKGLGLLWRHFWAWLSLTNTHKLFWRKIEAGFQVIFWAGKALFFMIPNIQFGIWYYLTVWFCLSTWQLDL